MRASTLRRDIALVTGLWLVFMLTGRSALLGDPGCAWHVAAGARMLALGRVLDTDPFGLTTQGRPWIAMQWLAELGMAFVHRAAGLDGLVACAAALLALTFAWLARSLRSQGASWALVALATAWAMAASSHHFLARPHLFTMLFVALTQSALLAWDAGARRVLWTFPLWFVVWTNLHGGVLGGIAVLVLTVAGHAVLTRLQGNAPRVVDRATPVVVALCLAAPFANPFGARLPQTWLSLSSSRVLPLAIKEHAAPDFTAPGQLLMLALAVLYVGLLATVPWRSLRATYLLPLPWLVLALRSVRHAPLFALVAVLTLPDLAHASSPKVRARLAGARDRLLRLTSPTGAGPVTGLWLTALLLVALSLACASAGLRLPIVGRGWARPPADVAPFDLLPALRAQAALRPAGSGILNEMIHGGFLIAHVPRLRVTIDDRWEVYGDAALAAYVHDSERAPERLLARADALHIDLALAPRDTPLERALLHSSVWRQAAAGSTARLFVRR